MSTSPQAVAALAFNPLTPDRWADFERLLGKNGADGCWCMWWRLKRSEFSRQAGEGNRQAMQGIVASGEIPGILAYAGDEVVGWCSVAPRERFGSLERSRPLKRLDDQPVWSIVCFFVARPYRRQGVSLALIRAAVDYVAQQGGHIVEAYPSPDRRGNPPVTSYMGSAATFAAAGFTVCAEPPGRRVIMRYAIPEGAGIAEKP